MRHTNFTLGLGMALGLALTACDPSQLTKANSDVTQPATEATVVGVWRTDIPVTSTNLPSVIKVTMEIKSSHTMVLSQRVATGQPAPYDFVEISNENWTWSVSDGNMLSVKTTCTYKDPATGQPTPETECRAPLNQTAPISVKGSAWTVVQSGQPIIFKKD